LLEAMQEQQVTIEGQSYKLELPFLVLATQNPIEQEGTYPLPQAQLDRFLLNIHIDYPQLEDEHAMVAQVAGTSVGDKLDVSTVNTVMQREEIVALQQMATQLTVDKSIVDYVVRVARATRDWNGIEAGAGPRGSIGLLRIARAHALVSGNEFVTPDDVKAVAIPALRHRIKLTADLEIEGYRADEVLQDILGDVEVPRA